MTTSYESPAPDRGGIQPTNPGKKVGKETKRSWRRKSTETPQQAKQTRRREKVKRKQKQRPRGEEEAKKKKRKKKKKKKKGLASTGTHE